MKILAGQIGGQVYQAAFDTLQSKFADAPIPYKDRLDLACLVGKITEVYLSAERGTACDTNGPARDDIFRNVLNLLKDGQNLRPIGIR